MTAAWVASSGKAQFVFGGLILQFAVVESAVVLQHGLFAQFAKGFAKFGGILFDDAGEGDDVNDAPHSVLFGVFQRECHGSESFSAAGRHGEREQPLRLCRLFYGMIENFAAQAVSSGIAFFGFGLRWSLGDTSSEIVDKLIEIVL